MLYYDELYLQERSTRGSTELFKEKESSGSSINHLLDEDMHSTSLRGKKTDKIKQNKTNKKH